MSGEKCRCCGQPLPSVEDWSGWIAVLTEEDGGDARWCVAPKDFWEANHYVPDTCLERVPRHFFECQEHTLDSSRSLPEQERLLRLYGFEIVKWEVGDERA